ncbi:MAG: hypothetical protein RIG82_10095 [Phycisphaeraceae bacterium]
MWHAFDILADHLHVPESLRQTAVPETARLVYGERIVRWFSDKSADGPWPADVDLRPGMVLSRTVGKDDLRLRIEQSWPQTVPCVLELDLVCEAQGLHTVRSWNAREVIGSEDQPSPLVATTERGTWEQGVLSRRHVGGRNEIAHQRRVGGLLSIYGFMGRFPLDAWPMNSQQADEYELLYERMLELGPVRLRQLPQGPVYDRPAAEGLKGYELRPERGFPLEFWVNGRGTVIYLVEAATRAWMLESVEAL